MFQYSPCPAKLSKAPCSQQYLEKEQIKPGLFSVGTQCYATKIERRYCKKGLSHW